ncbi:hypothetical protein BASA50_008578 [Batrachochytrium salamandrivorans]|uniref:Uncharacterized protein n=1 Tax=Batrachochytrium salamandrivorans TaxID=1357716 RepID=A0ABQ8F6X0_9FUNG|nr:hypothetical protein BASA60_010270 [Batrachochytrium salamandrivorans]KAH6591604.1 hypothetical protein BASA50_008578 [Batrachochytrium salamandrivorans]KAH6597306.1 hypothetical protein BASA61_003201 [Batrachochytrium salamandrivorans]
MVVIHVKRAEESLFLCKAPALSELSSLIPSIARLHNLRLRIARLISAAEDLILYGPLKPDNEQGYSDEQLEVFSASVAALPNKPRGQIYKNGFIFYENPDPTGCRIGQEMGSEATSVVRTTLNAATAAISKEQVALGIPLDSQILLNLVGEVQGALNIVYPEGLPKWEPLYNILEDSEDLSGTAASKEVVDPEEASIWWASKELQREKQLCDYVGKNDKTKIIVKIQKRGQGPPLREAPINEQQQKEMMAYYYRKQEEQKRLSENDEDEYLNSSWADTKSLKSTFNGMQSVKWKPC